MDLTTTPRLQYISNKLSEAAVAAHQRKGQRSFLNFLEARERFFTWVMFLENVGIVKTEFQMSKKHFLLGLAMSNE